MLLAFRRPPDPTISSGLARRLAALGLAWLGLWLLLMVAGLVLAMAGPDRRTPRPAETTKQIAAAF